MKKKYLIGIDVSKKTVDVSYFKRHESDSLSFQSKEAKVTGYKKFPNTVEGFHAMLAWLKSQESDLNEQNSLFVMEATGVYSNLLAKMFTLDSYFIWVESALQIKRSLGLQREKNDKVDSRLIAIYAGTFEGRAQQYLLPSSNIFKLRRLYLIRRNLVESKKALSSLILAHDCEDKIHDGSESVRRVLDTYDQEIKTIEKEIKLVIKIDAELSRLYKLLKSVPGIGPVIATFLIVRTNAFKAFGSASQFACYCGLAPFECSSGTSVKSRQRVSPFANREAKSLLYLAAKTSLRSDADLKTFFDKKRKEGKSYFSTMIAVANKLTKRIFSVIRNDKPYSKKRPEFQEATIRPREDMQTAS